MTFAITEGNNKDGKHRVVINGVTLNNNNGINQYTTDAMNGLVSEDENAKQIMSEINITKDTYFFNSTTKQYTKMGKYFSKHWSSHVSHTALTPSITLEQLETNAFRSEVEAYLNQPGNNPENDKDFTDAFRKFFTKKPTVTSNTIGLVYTNTDYTNIWLIYNIQTDQTIKTAIIKFLNEAIISLNSESTYLGMSSKITYTVSIDPPDCLEIIKTQEWIKKRDKQTKLEGTRGINNRGGFKTRKHIRRGSKRRNRRY